jgi:hypothetical protein
MGAVDVTQQRPFPRLDGARLREGLLWLGFLLVVVCAVITVAIPELSSEPEQGEARPPPVVAPPAKPKP